MDSHDRETLIKMVVGYAIVVVGFLLLIGLPIVSLFSKV